MQYGPLIAFKLGSLPQYRQGDEKVLWDIADGWEFYCGMFIANSQDSFY
jgi:hypothetical protein